MSRLFLTLISSLIFCLSLTAQSGFHLSSAVGIAWNNDLALVENKIDNSVGLSTDLNASFRFKLLKNIHSEIGLGGRYIASRGTVDFIDFKAQTLRLLLPISLGISLSEKWYLSTGLTFQNNKDFTKIDLREKYFWRLNGTLASHYTLSRKWALFAKFSYGVRGTNDTYLINDPRNLVSTGIYFNL